MFLTCEGHHHPGVWEAYFKGHEEQRTIYNNCKYPDRVHDFLRDHRIARVVNAERGELSHVEAYLALMEAALSDRRNEKFVFLSESYVSPALIHADHTVYCAWCCL